MSNPYLPQSPASTHPNSPRTPAGPSSQPITRSRTLFYLSIRDSSVTPRRGPRRSAASYGLTNDIAEEDDGLLRGHTVEMGLPPKWVDVSDEVEDLLGGAKTKIANLDKLHAKHVLPGFTDRTAEEREIERQTSDITKDFRRCTTLIGSIQPSRGAARAEVTTAKNVQRGLAQKVQDMSGQFRKKQRVYMQKLQGHAIKNKDLLAASGAITLKGSDVLDELQEDEQASRSQLQSQSQATTALNIDLDARTNEITQIATSISELADLFRDLGNLVVEQGTVLDSVEYNVQQTARELVAAEVELKEAQRYQANTGRRKCILFLILVIVGLIIVLIYKPRGRETVVVPGNEDGGQAASAIEAIGSATATATDSSTSTSTRHRYRPKPSLGQYTTGEVITVSGGANPTISRGRLPLPKPPPLPTRPIDGEGAPF